MKVMVYILLAMLVPVEICAQNAASSNAPPETVAAQAASSPSLHVIANVRSQFLGTNFGQVVCDANGNVYARKYDVSVYGSAFERAPVQEIGADGRLSVSFGVPDALPDASVSDFFVASDGRVYLLASAREAEPPGYGAYVLRFAANGALESKIRVDTEERFSPVHIGVFKSGEILITGRQGKMNYAPFTGVFSSTGGLIKTIFEPEDEDLRLRAQAGDEDVLAHSNFGNEAVDLGSVAAGSDGNMYVMRRTSPALIYVISSRGSMVRKLHVSADDPAMFPRALEPFAGGLVVMFGRRGMGARAR
ncbi:MAG: hypothetical protein WB558_24255 [Terriglobales bacterium]